MVVSQKRPPASARVGSESHPTSAHTPKPTRLRRDHLTKGGPPLAPADVAPQDGGPEEPNPCQRGEVRGSELLEEPAGPQLGLRDMRLGGGLERLAAYVTLAANVALSAR